MLLKQNSTRTVATIPMEEPDYQMTERDYICADCYNQGMCMFIYGGKCIRCGGQKLVSKLVLKSDPKNRWRIMNTQLVLPEKETLPAVTGTVLTGPQAIAEYDSVRRAIVEAEYQRFMVSPFIPKTITIREEKERAAWLLADMQYQTGLLVATKQIMLVDFNKDKDSPPDWQILVGYTSYEHIARRHVLATGEDFSVTDVTRDDLYTAEEIVATRANRCPTCSGRGTLYNKQTGKFDKKCYRCGASKTIPPDRMMAGESYLYYTADKKAADKVGMPYKPSVGFAIWYEWENVPNTKSALWLLSKRARTDILRRKFSYAMKLNLLTQDNQLVQTPIQAVDSEQAWGDDDIPIMTDDKPPIGFPFTPESEPDPKTIEQAHKYLTDVGYRNITVQGKGKLFDIMPEEVFGREKTWDSLSQVEFYNLMLYLALASDLDSRNPQVKEKRDELKQKCVACTSRGEFWVETLSSPETDSE